MPNQFEQAAREKKITALVAYFDEFLVEVRLDPQRDAQQIADVLLNMRPEVWKHHAIYAGQRPPSDKTIAGVVSAYLERAAMLRRGVAS